MKDQFIPYEYAKMMKELGYNERCNTFYYDSKSGVEKTDIRNSEMKEKCCQAPLFQQAEEWLWDIYKIYIADIPHNKYHFEVRKVEGVFLNINGYIKEIESIGYDSPITAHREGILQAIAYIYKNK